MTLDEFCEKIDEAERLAFGADYRENMIREFFAQAVAEEREACASIAETITIDKSLGPKRTIALAIRHREASCPTPS